MVYPWSLRSVIFFVASEYVVGLLGQATTYCEGDMLTACLIFARQAALEGAHVHPPYQKWFQVCHMQLIRPKKTIESYAFFLNHVGPVWFLPTLLKETTSLCSSYVDVSGAL